jgi:hypothetical protein
VSVEGRQAFAGGTSRISREAYVRFCEGLGVQVPGATRRQHGDQGMSSNWRNRPRPAAKSAEPGTPHNRVSPGKWADDETVADGSGVARKAGKAAGAKGPNCSGSSARREAGAP